MRTRFGESGCFATVLTERTSIKTEHIVHQLMRILTHAP